MRNICKFCQKPIKHNTIFYNLIFDRKGKEWQFLTKEEQGNMISELRKEGIFPKLNLDGSSHICGQDNQFYEEIENRIIKKCEEMRNEILSEIKKEIASQFYKIQKTIDEFKDSLDSRIKYHFDLYMKK